MWNGAATSTIANKTVSDYLSSKGLKVTVSQAKVTELASYPGSVDLIILMATGAKIPSNITAPVIKGLPFLTGMGKEEALKQIEEIIKQ